MLKLSVCLLTCNSSRLLREVLPPLLKVADELIVIDSGSTDATLQICQQFGLTAHHHPYVTHGAQMNYAISRATHDWVLCMDSDEILDDEVTAAILALKAGDEPDPACAWRLPRYWFVLGEEVRTIYPVSSPDFPVRLFNRAVARFNDRPVDDQVVGFKHDSKLPGFVRHDTFYSLHEVFSKLNSYTTRLVVHQKIRPSIGRGIISAIGAFFKWYLFSGAWRKGKVGVVTGLYATFYSFLKYFKAWYAHQDKQEPAAKKHTDSRTV
ncbi:glycosyltransferase family 2 protein [Klebsiella indica]|uniref:Glycosyltransferase family 2 protein n=1 Tax=Klebsiella indica TaxID=2582917 RepID=A0A5R9LHP0_9ENTR|nr:MULTISPECIES: glycosyltransferase family 2 protein [Klebsiella]TLV17835.1 glycosyltransferase family 2 protein [Klebsiella indica]